MQQTVNSQPTNYTVDLNTGLTQVLADGTDAHIYGLDRIAQADNKSKLHILRRHCTFGRPKLMMGEMYLLMWRS